MLPALMAARPLIKYGILIGVPLAILLTSYTYVFFKGDSRGEKRILAQWDAANAKLAKEATQQVLDVRAMEAQLADAKAENAKIRAQQEAVVKRKVQEYANSHPAIPLSLQFRGVYDDLRRMSNEAGNELPAADSDAGRIQVPSGEVRTPSVGVVSSPDADADPITTDALYQAVVHTHEMLGLCKDDYGRASGWNDGRELIELRRLQRQ